MAFHCPNGLLHETTTKSAPFQCRFTSEPFPKDLTVDTNLYGFWALPQAYVTRPPLGLLPRSSSVLSFSCVTERIAPHIPICICTSMGFPPDSRRRSIRFDRFSDIFNHFQSRLNRLQVFSLLICFNQFDSVKNARIYWQPEGVENNHDLVHV